MFVHTRKQIIKSMTGRVPAINTNHQTYTNLSVKNDQTKHSFSRKRHRAYTRFTSVPWVIGYDYSGDVVNLAYALLCSFHFHFSFFSREKFARHFGAARVALGAILGPSGSRRGSSNRTFPPRINIKYQKMRSRKASGKNMIFGWIFDARMGGLECREPSWRVILVTI